MAKTNQNQIIVDINNEDEIKKTLEYLNQNFEVICKLADEYCGMEFGLIIDGSFMEYTMEPHPLLPSYSELAFFMVAARNYDNLVPIQQFLQQIIAKGEYLWFDDEMPMGMNAAFAVAILYKEYIICFILICRASDMDNETFQAAFIEMLLNHHGICNETLDLIAARACSISGQYGLEGIEIEGLSIEQKNAFFQKLLFDAFYKPVVYPDLLIDALEQLDISVNKEKFNALFSENRPAYAPDDLPSLNSVAN